MKLYVYESFDRDIRLVLRAAAIMQHMTGDACEVMRMEGMAWRVVRVDASGKDVS